MAVMTSPAMAWYGRGGWDVVWPFRRGKAGIGAVWSGRERQSRLGQSWQEGEWFVRARQSWQVWVGIGKVWTGLAWQYWHGGSGRGQV